MKNSHFKNHKNTKIKLSVFSIFEIFLTQKKLLLYVLMFSYVLNSPLWAFQQVLARLFLNIVIDVDHDPLAQPVLSKDCEERGEIFLCVLL